MTTAAELLTDIQAHGIELQPHGAALRFRPRDKVAPALLARLQAHKPELLRLLAGCPQALQPSDPSAAIATGDAAPVDELPDLQRTRADGRPLQAHAVPVTARLPATGGPHDAYGNAEPGLQPSDGDQADWTEYTTADGRHGWLRCGSADCEIIDVPEPCLNCTGIVFWWDLAGGQHCEACSPRTAGPRLRELAQRLRQRHARKAAG
jgi:hypothetical protein